MPVRQAMDGQGSGASSLRLGALTAVESTATSDHAAAETQPPVPPTGRPTLTRVK
jgi:hypothetical protein